MTRLPLFHDWERIAAKDLVEIQSILVNGVFENPADFAARLRRSAEAIEQQYGGQLSDFDPLPYIDSERFAAVLQEGEN